MKTTNNINSNDSLVLHKKISTTTLNFGPYRHENIPI